MERNYKADFPLLAGSTIAYLDSAATAQRPQCVLDAQRDFDCHHNANPLRGLYPLSVEATEIYEDARERVRAFLHARSAREIIFTRNTTESLNLVAYSYGLSHLRAGDEVLVSIMEHHSDFLPWQMVCRQTGAQLRFLECAPDGSLDLNRVEQCITGRTRLVAITQVSNVLGRRYPVKEIAALAHRRGAVVVVDGAQSTPHLPVDVQDLDADFFALSGHKLYGPMGIGVLYGKEALLEEMGFGKTPEYTVQPGGGNLSPGERKKLLLTRAFLRDAPFLLLDEPMNHLDAQAAEVVKEKLRQRQGGILLISHREDICEGLGMGELLMKRKS